MLKTGKTIKIKPELSSGLKDYLPDEMAFRNDVLEKVRKVCEVFGYLPLETPAIEKKEILTGGDPGFKKQIFEIKSRDNENNLALRFDLTVPLARVVSAYPSNLKKPFKRYQIGKVWRGERSQAGRFKEFLQFDADIIGAPDSSADAEVISLISTILLSIGIKNFSIKINNRKLLNGLSEYAGFPFKKISDVLRILDKTDKAGWPSVKKELAAKSGAGLNVSQVGLVEEFIAVKEKSPEATLAKLETMMGRSGSARAGIGELKSLIGHLRAFKVPDQNWTLDLSVARGLGYYTGVVFEAIFKDALEIGSIFSGGRYDDLTARFGGNPIPATGASLGVDRLFTAMTKLGLIKNSISEARVAVLNFDPSCTEWLEGIVADLRSKDIRVDFYLGQERTLKGQLAYAISREFPLIIIAGSSERDSNIVQLKDAIRRKQSSVKIKDLIEAISNIQTIDK